MEQEEEVMEELEEVELRLGMMEELYMTASPHLFILEHLEVMQLPLEEEQEEGRFV